MPHCRHGIELPSEVEKVSRRSHASLRAKRPSESQAANLGVPFDHDLEKTRMSNIGATWYIHLARGAFRARCPVSGSDWPEAYNEDPLLELKKHVHNVRLQVILISEAYPSFRVWRL